jgi:hypothetical protein
LDATGNGSGRKAALVGFIPIFLILFLFGIYLFATAPSFSGNNQFTTTSSSSILAPLLTNVSLSEYTSPLIQRISTTPHGDPQYYPSLTYDEVHFRIILPLSLFPLSGSHTSYFYLDGLQLGCDGIDMIPVAGINSVETDGYACQLSSLFQIGSLHNLTVLISNTNGDTFRLQSSVAVTYSEAPSLPPTAQSSNESLGLQLVLSLNTTMLEVGQTLNVSALILNTLPNENNVSGGNNWALLTLPITTSFPCPTFLYYQVFQGFYLQANLSTAGMPLQVTPVFQFLSCPIFQRGYYIFQSYSASAAVAIGFSTSNTTTLFQVEPMSVTGYLSGNYSREYNASIFAPNGELSPPPFRPGVYTIIAGDEWGQQVVLHFVVRKLT